MELGSDVELPPDSIARPESEEEELQEEDEAEEETKQKPDPFGGSRV